MRLQFTATRTPDAQHVPAIFECGGTEYEARISTSDETDTAVVFVHGFNGDPKGTWHDFQSMIDTHGSEFPYWKTSDAFFFKYDSVFQSMDDSADVLEQLVSAIFPNVRNLKAPKASNLAVIARRCYSKLILVGHSEGAVILRSLIRRLGTKFHGDVTACPILGARVVFFAPAHFGFVPVGMLAAIATLTGFSGIFKFCVAASPAASELHDKTVLLHLKDVMNQLYRESPETPAYQAHVLFGKGEQVVVREYYYQDCRHKPEAGKDHFSVCKPNPTYKRPLELIVGDCP